MSHISHKLGLDHIGSLLYFCDFCNTIGVSKHILLCFGLSLDCKRNSSVTYRLTCLFIDKLDAYTERVLCISVKTREKQSHDH